MISSSTVCGPLCQHPGCWKAKCYPSSQDTPNEFISPIMDASQFELPTLSIRYVELFY